MRGAPSGLSSLHRHSQPSLHASPVHQGNAACLAQCSHMSGSRFAARVAAFQRLYTLEQARLASLGSSTLRATITHPGLAGGHLEVPLTYTPLQALKALGLHGSKEDPVVVARVGGRLCGLRDPLSSVLGGEGEGGGGVPAEALLAPLPLEFVHFSSREGKSVFWHSGAHILGAALEAHFGPATHLLDGPPVLEGEGGFFYDTALPNGAPLVEGEYAPIEAAARAVAAMKAPFERLPISRPLALDLFGDSPHKLDLLHRIPPQDTLTVYRCGPFVDLCRGPHVPHTGVFGAFKLTRASAITGGGSGTGTAAAAAALQRAYGIAFPTPTQLSAWGVAMEEARSRDHRVVGKAQKLFFFHDTSPGSAFLLPHGTRIINRLTALLRSQYRRRGYEEVQSPLLYKKSLWKTSGHLEAYAEDMFSAKPGGLVPAAAAAAVHTHHAQSCSHTLGSPSPEGGGEGQAEEEDTYGLKPMNCPGHCLIFAQRLVSYRDLPLRYADFSALHRNEASGALGGLTRLRRFSQDDAHIFCTPEQVGGEVGGCLDFISHIYALLHFRQFRAVLSTRPTDKPTVGSGEGWVAAEAALRAALLAFLPPGAPLEVDVGGGAFYGPKIDVFVKDALGREHQCATVQLDFNLPARFKLEYRVGGGGEGPASGPAAASFTGPGSGPAGTAPTVATPVMIHRAVLGSLERMLGVLIEHTGGKWPFWLSPRQVLLCTVAERHGEYAAAVAKALQFPPTLPPPSSSSSSSSPSTVVGGEMGAEGECEDTELWVEVDGSGRSVGKKVREGQGQGFNLCVLVGDEEVVGGTGAVRFRDASTYQAFCTARRALGGVDPGTAALVGEGKVGKDGVYASPIVTLPIPELTAICKKMMALKL
jgi:threonyl-tRNA synthetase